MINSAVNDNCRNTNLSQGSQLSFQLRVARITTSISHAMTIGVNGHFDKIRIVEQCGGLLIRLVVESPLR